MGESNIVAPGIRRVSVHGPKLSVQIRGTGPTIVMEMGLIHPPVGLNLFVIKNIAPDIPLGAIIRGVIPFVALMLLTVVLISAFPTIATALPDLVMGPNAHAN